MRSLRLASSDADGNFELTGLRAGGYAVTISDYPEGTEFPVTTRDVTVGVGLSATVSFNAPGEDQPTTGTNPFSPFITEVTSDSDDGTYSGRADCHGRHRARARRRTIREDHPVRGCHGGGQPVLRLRACARRGP